MASVVSIQIKVDNGQALPSIDQLNKALSDVGTKGTASFRQASEGADGMRGHVSTGLDSVRLLSQEFGLRLPRAMEAMISRMPGVTGALGSVLGIMAGIAAAQVFVHVAEEVYHAYEQYVSLNAAADKYYETLKKTRDADFGAPRDLETGRQRFNLATNAAQLKQQQAIDLRNKSMFELNPVSAIGDFFHARSLSDEAATSMGQRDKTGAANIDLSHQQALQQIELKHSKDGELVGQQKINAELAKTLQLNAENSKYSALQEKSAGNIVATNAGDADLAIKNQTARAKANAQTDVASRESALAIMKLRDSAAQAGLSGEELYFRKMQDDTHELTVSLTNAGKAAEIPASVRDINEKYFAEMADRQTKAQNEGSLSIQRASASGLTGAARINADHDIQVNQINSDRGLVESGQAPAERQAAAVEQNNKLLALQQQFTEQMKSLEDGRVESALNGYARIDAAAQKQIDQVNKTYNASFGGADPNASSTLVVEKAKQDGITSIQAGAAQQRQELTNNNNAETLRYDQQAADAEKMVRENGIMGWVASYRDAITEIQAQDAAQTAKLQDELSKRQIDQETFDKRKTDIDEEANANIAQQNQQMQQKIAGDLQEAFTNPVDFIKSQMEKMFFEIIAGWVMRMTAFKTLFGQTMGSLQPGAPSGGTPVTAPGILGSIGSVIAGAHGPVAGHSATADGVGAISSIGGVVGSIPGTRGIVGGHPDISSIYTSAASSGTASATVGQAQESVGGYHAPSSVGSSISEVSSAARTLGNIGNLAHSASTPDTTAGGVGTISSIGGVVGSIPGTRGIVSGHPNISSIYTSDGSSGTTSATVGQASTGGYHAPSSVGSPISEVSSAARTLGNISNLAHPASTPDTSAGPDADSTTMAGISDANAAQQASSTASTVTKGMSGTASHLSGLAAAGMGAYTAEQTTVKAFETGNPLQGAVGDAAAGASIGMLAGPVGAVVGAGIGAAVGASAGLVGMVSGEAGQLGARSYYEKDVLPTLEGYMSSSGSDYQSAVSQVGSTSGQAMAYMVQHFGQSAADWVNSNYMQKEVTLVLSRIEDAAAGGRQYTTLSAAQFHTGGTVTGFGSFGTSSNEGFIHAMLGETVMNTQASSVHAPVLSAMQSGASASDVASMYLATAKPSGGSVQQPSGDTHNWSVNALDAKSFSTFLKQGGAQQIVKHTNTYASQYAGDGISG